MSTNVHFIIGLGLYILYVTCVGRKGFVNLRTLTAVAVNVTEKFVINSPLISLVIW